MKILLTQDIPRVGSKGDIIEVAQSYGMNAFVSKGLARIATSNDEKMKAQKEQNRKEKKEVENDKSVEIMRKLEKSELIIKKKIDAKGHLYSKISVSDVVDAAYTSDGISLNPKSLNLEKIETLGDYIVEANVNAKRYKLKVKVVKDLD
jgi:large subunit ribosomal protein L9